LFFFLLIRFTRRPALIFRIAGVAFLLFSLAGPFGITGIDTSSAVVLNVMHLVAGGAILYLLPRWARG
jgi:multisubunit Na+/H+ antiporter MnhF subunit